VPQGGVTKITMKLLNLLAIVLLLVMSSFVLADDESISGIYKKYGVEGALIIVSVDGDVEYMHNARRCNQRYLPASTFKIPNTLIALETGAIKDDKEIFKWDGSDKGWSSWNRDQTLATAFSLSCVWCYQGFAKQINNERYKKYLLDLNYGNKKTGKDVTTFWLEGELGISVIEQISFLRKLYLEKLPFKSDNIKILKKIMLVEETPDYTLWAKTGWANRIQPQHGWYVGYIEAKGKVWLFANNIQIRSKADLEFRKRLVIESLKLKEVIF